MKRNVVDAAGIDALEVAVVAESVGYGVRCYCFGMSRVPGATDLRIDMSGERFYGGCELWF